MYQFKMMLALKKITGPFQTEEITGECTCRLALESEQCYPETCECAPGLSTKDLFRWQLISKDFYPCFDL